MGVFNGAGCNYNDEMVYGIFIDILAQKKKYNEFI